MRIRAGATVSSVPVAAAMALLAFSLAGARLYASSAGSAAFADQIDETCRSDSAMTLPIPSTPGGEAQVAAIGERLVHVDAPRRGSVAVPRVVIGDAAPRRVTVLHLADVATLVTPPLVELGPYEVAVTRTNLRELAVAVGDRVTTETGVPLTVRQVVDDVPNAPVPDPWCGWRELFEPTPAGDAPPPSLIASPETIAALGGYSFDEYRVTRDRLTISQARAAAASFEVAAQEWETAFASQLGELEPSEMSRVVLRAVAVTDTVERSLAPVLLTAMVAVSVVLAAAAVLLARARRRELRILSIRGLPPWRIATGLAGELGLSLGFGALTGAACAYGSVRAFGPSALLEPGAVARSAVLVGIALAVAVPTVALEIATVTDRSVDRGRRRVGPIAVVAAVVVALVVLAVLAFQRLDRDGGIRTFGVESRGGALLALGFPLFALLAITATAAVAVVVIARRLRLSGGGLPRAIRLGWRRVVLEGPSLGAIVAAVALAAGCLSTSNALASAARRQLEDKAEVYVGSDLAVIVYDEPPVPPGWAGATSVASTARWRQDGRSIELLGVDPATFAAATRLRDDASDRSLAEIVDGIDSDGFAPGRPVAAIAVGAEADVGDVLTLTPPGATETIEVEIVGALAFFPYKSGGAEMFVVDRAAVVARVGRPTGVLFALGPPEDAIGQLQDLGVRTGIVRDVDRAFDGSAYSALRWAYAPLAVLGALFAVVALSLQLLLVAARTTTRRATHAVMRRTGFGTRDVLRASVVEVALPLVVGVAVGVGAAVLGGGLAVPRLDPMPSLQPPSRFAMPWATVLGVAAAVPIWTAAVAALITRLTVRADPMEALHGEL